MSFSPLTCKLQRKICGNNGKNRATLQKLCAQSSRFRWYLQHWCRKCFSILFRFYVSVFGMSFNVAGVRYFHFFFFFFFNLFGRIHIVPVENGTKNYCTILWIICLIYFSLVFPVCTRQYVWFAMSVYRISAPPCPFHLALQKTEWKTATTHSSGKYVQTGNKPKHKPNGKRTNERNGETVKRRKKTNQEKKDRFIYCSHACTVHVSCLLI